MKLSFTTLGCPAWDLKTIAMRAAEYGYDGVDFRGLQGNLNLYETAVFTTDIADTQSRLDAAGLAVSCFSSSITLVAKEREALNMEELERYAELCSRFGTRFIRAFGGKLNGLERSSGVEIAAAQLERMEPVLRDAGVKLLIETHDDWIRCEDALQLLSGASADAVGILWDVHHPYRMCGEAPQRTWDVLGSRIEYTHWKDSLPNAAGDGSFRYRFMGEGDVPFTDILAVLKAGGYNGWYTFEWEKKWIPDLEEPELAFPQFVRFMRKLGGA